MSAAHVAHDCTVGNHVIILANNVLLAGHVTIEDRAFVSGSVGIHQFCRIGTLAMVGGWRASIQDVPPYTLIDGASGCVVGLNLVGLRRNGFTTEQVAVLKCAYRAIYRRGHQMERGPRNAQDRIRHRPRGRVPQVSLHRHSRLRPRTPPAARRDHQAPRPRRRCCRLRGISDRPNAGAPEQSGVKRLLALNAATDAEGVAVGVAEVELADVPGLVGRRVGDRHSLR